MRIKSILLLLVCFLLSGLTMPAIACPPPYCGSCCHWVSTGPNPEDGYCDLNTGVECGDCQGCYNPCNSCVSCSCVWDCTPTQFCCTDSGDYCCPSGYTCCNGSCCDPYNCEICVGGKCVDKCADCMSCVYGDCVDIQCKVILGGCQRCNETTGECEYSCSDEGCGEICVRNECVPDCDSVGSYCDWTFPPIQSGCPGTHIEDLSCAPGVTDLTCDWKVVESFSNSATGPCKVPGGFCATLEPVICKDKFIPTMGMVCSCTGTPALVYYQYRTARYKCPGDPW